MDGSYTRAKCQQFIFYMANWKHWMRKSWKNGWKRHTIFKIPLFKHLEIFFSNKIAS